MEELNSLYQLIKSRNELTVPVIKGVHLHSKYNPLKEAAAFAKGFHDAISKKNHILIFGLGFGYHIDAIYEIASKYHDHVEIIIVEPYKKLIDDFNTERAFNANSIKIINELNINKLFETKDFISFLLKKPCIIKHDTSFNLHRDYFSQLLTYSSDNQIERYLHLLTDKSFANYLDTYKNGSIDHLAKSISENSRINNKNDYAILAMAEILNESNAYQRGQND